MTDYKSLKLIASSSPHIRSNEDTRSIMLDVIIALMPALVMGVYVFGWRALTSTLVSVASCVVWEWIYRKLLKKSCSVGDLSAVVTGILLAFVCPVQTPYWMLVIGAFFSIVLVKQLYGGIGCNFLNPALAGRAILLASYAGAMTNYVKVGEKAALIGSNADIVTAATPLAMMKGVDATGWETLTNTYTLGDMFIGRIGGSLGEVSALMLLLGGVYLLLRKVISWQIPVAYIATVAIICLISAPEGVSGVEYMAYNVFGGGLMLGAIFMATDYATSPVTKPGQLIFGIGCGLLTVLIRRFGSYPEGVCYSIMIMNCTTWLLDKYIRPTIYGALKKEKKEATK
ncbi:MAG: RnfABCDGE type electron transport complex subunit D [Clostridiales bacterium]|nr:RnfABCDGE type electron transport complex subunit D [Clostridiales bacterium]MCI6999754.1 RnfABCDGE type electron transport complex subunit D [Clostridiales bacterium]